MYFPNGFVGRRKHFGQSDSSRDPASMLQQIPRICVLLPLLSFLSEVYVGWTHLFWFWWKEVGRSGLGLTCYVKPETSIDWWISLSFFRCLLSTWPMSSLRLWSFTRVLSGGGEQWNWCWRWACLQRPWFSTWWEQPQEQPISGVARIEKKHQFFISLTLVELWELWEPRGCLIEIWGFWRPVRQVWA